MARAVKLAENVMMPLLSFGTYRIQGAKLVRTLDCALKNGYRSFDTAQSYENEADLGKALKELLPQHKLKREDVFITSKILPEHPNTVGPLVKQSLSDLGTPYIDLMLIHYPMCVMSETAGLLADNHEMWGADSVVNTKADNREWRIGVWKALENAQKEGKVKAIGVSNYESRHIESMTRYADIFPVLNQIEFHPHLQRPEIQRTIAQFEMVLQAYAPLGRQQPALLMTPLLNQIAAKHSASVAQVMLAWAMQQGIGVVPKSDNPNRIESNFASTKLKLDEEEIKQMNQLDTGTAYTMCAPWKVK